MAVSTQLAQDHLLVYGRQYVALLVIGQFQEELWLRASRQR